MYVCPLRGNPVRTRTHTWLLSVYFEKATCLSILTTLINVYLRFDILIENQHSRADSLAPGIPEYLEREVNGNGTLITVDIKLGRMERRNFPERKSFHWIITSDSKSGSKSALIQFEGCLNLFNRTHMVE